MDGDRNNRRGSIGRASSIPKGKGKGKGKEKETDASQHGDDVGPRGGDTYNARAIRHALRVFVATGIGAKAVEMVLARIKGQNT